MTSGLEISRALWRRLSPESENPPNSLRETRIKPYLFEPLDYKYLERVLYSDGAQAAYTTYRTQTGIFRSPLRPSAGTAEASNTGSRPFISPSHGREILEVSAGRSNIYILQVQKDRRGYKKYTIQRSKVHHNISTHASSQHRSIVGVDFDERTRMFVDESKGPSRPRLLFLLPDETAQVLRHRVMIHEWSDDADDELRPLAATTALNLSQYVKAASLVPLRPLSPTTQKSVDTVQAAVCDLLSDDGCTIHHLVFDGEGIKSVNETLERSQPLDTIARLTYSARTLVHNGAEMTTDALLGTFRRKGLHYIRVFGSNTNAFEDVELSLPEEVPDALFTDGFDRVCVIHNGGLILRCRHNWLAIYLPRTSFRLPHERLREQLPLSVKSPLPSDSRS